MNWAGLGVGTPNKRNNKVRSILWVKSRAGRMLSVYTFELRRELNIVLRMPSRDEPDELLQTNSIHLAETFLIPISHKKY